MSTESASDFRARVMAEVDAAAVQLDFSTTVAKAISDQADRLSSPLNDTELEYMRQWFDNARRTVEETDPRRMPLPALRRRALFESKARAWCQAALALATAETAFASMQEHLAEGRAAKACQAAFMAAHGLREAWYAQHAPTVEGRLNARAGNRGKHSALTARQRLAIGRWLDRRLPSAKDTSEARKAAYAQLRVEVKSSGQRWTGAPTGRRALGVMLEEYRRTRAARP